MRRYDPLKAPNPTEWLALDEEEGIDLVQNYHRRAGIRLPNDRLHAALHVTIENQIALGDELPVERTLHRLMSEGLDRHEAVHAIGSVLTDLIYDVSKGEVADEDPNPGYMAKVERLTAEGWRRMWDEPEEPDDSTTPELDESHILDELDVSEDDDSALDLGDRGRPWSPSVPAINPFKSVGRNDPCPCGSGKKFKKCHGAGM